MAKKAVFTVGFELPGDEFEYIEFSSDRTLLDADIILYRPIISGGASYEQFNGKALLTEETSFSVKRRLDHWRGEITAAVKAGKLVIVFLVKPTEYYRYTGEKNYSGTGRSRVTQPIVVPVSSYDAIPHIKGS